MPPRQRRNLRSALCSEKACISIAKVSAICGECTRAAPCVCVYVYVCLFQFFTPFRFVGCRIVDVCRMNRFVLLISLAKASGAFTWAATDVLLIRMAAVYFRIHGSASLSLSVVYMSSGAGVAIGPWVLQRFVRDGPRANQNMILIGLAVITAGTAALMYHDKLIVFALLNTS